MAARRHLLAWNRAMRAAGLDREPLAALFVVTGADVARLLDSGLDERRYLSVLRMHLANVRELPRWAALAEEMRGERLADESETGPETAPSEPETAATVSVLDALRARKRGGRP